MNFKLLLSIITIALLCSFVLKKELPVNIVFIGDSITQGNKLPGDTPPDYAGGYLKLHEYPKTTIANCGVSGRTTYDFLPDTKLYAHVKTVADSFYLNQEAMLIFSIMIGTNDSAIEGPNGAPVAPDQYRHNMKIIIDSLLQRYPEAKVVVNYPIWYSDNTHNRSTYMKEGQQRVVAYQSQIDMLINNYKKSHPHHVFKGDTKAYNYFKQNYLTDFKPETGADGVFYLHPNNKGDRALGEFWAKAIVKAIR